MKLSLWQQFSGNHSSSFMIVAQFETVEWAEQVHKEVQSIVRDINDWWDQIPDDEQDGVEAALNEQRRITPPEREIQRRYQINLWATETFLTWLLGEDAVDSILRMDDLVIMISGETWDDAHPFEEILRKLGGRVAVEVEEGDTYIVLNLRMTAPDDTTAQALNTYLVEEDEYGETEIMLAFPGLPKLSGAIRTEGIQVFIDEIRVWENYELLIPAAELLPDTSALMLSDGMAEIDVDFTEMLQRLLSFLRAQGMTSISYQIVQMTH